MKILIKYNYHRDRIIEDFNNSFIQNENFRKTMMVGFIGSIFALFLLLILLAINLYVILIYFYYYKQPLMYHITLFLASQLPFF